MGAIPQQNRTTEILQNTNNRYLTIYSLRYNDIKQDIAEELEGLREEGATLENVSSNFRQQVSREFRQSNIDKISTLSSNHLKGFNLLRLRSIDMVFSSN